MPLTTTNQNESSLTFWEHLEVLRWMLFRIIALLFVVLAVIFSNKEFVFNQLILPPLDGSFITYRWMCNLSELLKMPSLCPGEFTLQLVNYDISGQFMAHISTSFTLALVLIVPYLLYEIWRFVSPALYSKEKATTAAIFLSSSILFYLGAIVSYLLIFPLSIRFLGSYQVSSLVPNHIALQSYLATLYLLIFALGILFELPVLAYLLSRAGVINRQMLRAGRNIAVMVILILSAIITPTTDPFTMLVVAAPIYLLYELSIVICKK
jgi:sec-independent protein translocase protein TatC